MIDEVFIYKYKVNNHIYELKFKNLEDAINQSNIDFSYASTCPVSITGENDFCIDHDELFKLFLKTMN